MLILEYSNVTIWHQNIMTMDSCRPMFEIQHHSGVVIIVGIVTFVGHHRITGSLLTSRISTPLITHPENSVGSRYFS